jgi:hypothetical protein
MNFTTLVGYLNRLCGVSLLNLNISDCRFCDDVELLCSLTEFTNHLNNCYLLKKDSNCNSHPLLCTTGLL